MDIALSGKSNIIVMMQLLASYITNDGASPRTFTFIKNGKLKWHKETNEEIERRKSYISETTRAYVISILEKKLKEIYNNKLGKVYLDPDLENYALPINMSVNNSGVGVLPSGSRVKIGKTNLRLFTYWEKVNDIDLSCFLINKDNSVKEISWRTFGFQDPSSGIVFSGDQTSGYHGGSEFFDIEFSKVKKNYPKAKYIVFCDNIYTHGVTFDQCVCKAGYMLREDLDAGQVYGPSTVRTAFMINTPSSMCYLFAIDMDTLELVWLNLKRDSNYAIAGNDSISTVFKYIEICSF